jgi:hypothetical protein
MNPIRSALLVCALVGASYTTINAEDAPKGRGEKVAVDTLPEAVKATFAKEAPDVKEVYKSNRDGKVGYRVRITVDGKNLMLVVGEDGAVVSKEPAKERPKN